MEFELLRNVENLEILMEEKDVLSSGILAPKMAACAKVSRTMMCL